MCCLSRRRLIGYISSIGLICLIGVTSALSAGPPIVPLRGEIRDAETGLLLPARLYIQSADGARWFFAKSADAQGSALVYDKFRDAKSVEKHTTLSAHPFVAEVPPGKYTLTVERGKEYLTATKEVEVGTQPLDVKIELRRWINMAERGWYSGDTHVHRPISELSNVALAEDLNMVYPMSQWVTVTHTLPEKGRVDPQPIPTAPIFAAPTHAIVPFNTEYEIFSVGAKRHTLGAVLILGQKEPLKIGIPPLKAVADEAHRQGGLLDLEKHSWAWTPIIAPVMKADLYPLSNNHIWRTEFAFKQWTIENNWRDNPAHRDRQRRLHRTRLAALRLGAILRHAQLRPADASDRRHRQRRASRPRGLQSSLCRSRPRKIHAGLVAETTQRRPQLRDDRADDRIPIRTICQSSGIGSQLSHVVAISARQDRANGRWRSLAFNSLEGTLRDAPPT